jgi:hypothetical protein
MHRKFKGLAIIGLLLFQHSSSASKQTWDKEPWDRDDKPYMALLAKVQKELSAHKSKNAQLTIYKRIQQQARQNSQMPTAIFEWGTATYIALRTKVPIAQVDVAQCLNSIRLAPTPRTYSYARMRFLLEKTQGGAYSEPFLRVGSRLLQRRPNDYAVKFYHIRSLRMVTETERKMGIAYAHDLIRMRPNYHQSYAALGRVYENIWIMNNVKSDPKKKGRFKIKWIGTLDSENRLKAISAYRKAQSLITPRDDSYAFYSAKVKSLSQKHQ